MLDVVWSVGMMVLAAGAEAGTSPLKLDAATLESWEKVRPVGATWTAREGVWVAEATPSEWWRMLVGGSAEATDYTVEVHLTIVKPNPDTGFYGGPSFCNYWNGTRDGGYDAAVVARYTGPDYFRLQLSTRYQEATLFKQSGGFVQVRPCTLKAGVTYRVRLEVSGARLRAWVEPAAEAPAEKALIEYWDPIRPIPRGRYGVGFYNSQVRFERIAVGPAAPAGDRPARAPSRFTVRPWRTMKHWIFDHDEPIAHLDETRLVLWNAKLVPGYAPMGYWELHWKQYDGEHNYANRLDELVTDEQGGPRLRLHWVSHNESPPAKFVELNPELKDKPYAAKPVRIITNRARLDLTYDESLRTYVYAVDTEFTVDPDRYWKYTADGLEYCNLIPYNVVGPATAMPEPWPWAYQWVLIRGADDKVYRHPIHHNGIGAVYPKPDGGFYCYALGEVLNPATEFANPADPKLNPYAGLCNWAYDIHFRYQPYKPGEIIPAGTRHHAKYRVLNYDPARTRKLMDQSELLPAFRTDREFAVFVWGLNDFKLGRRYSEPHVEWAWGGTWDKTVGRGDTFSLRLERKDAGVSRAEQTGGPSFFMPRYEDGVYELSGWIRTQNVQGKGATLYVVNNQRQYSHGPVRVTGTQDWTRISFQPDNVAARFYQVSIGLELDGTGTAWFDDVELKRVGDKK